MNRVRQDDTAVRGPGLVEGLLGTARSVKHWGFVARKRSLRTADAARITATSSLWRDMEKRRPYSYTPGMYRRSFVNWDSEPSEGGVLTRRIFTIWTGDSAMPEARERGLDALRSMQTGIEVVLVTPDTLSSWIVPGAPLHSAYENLSLVHRSDYLRAYLLHHHGGGYSDVKASFHHWGAAFDQLEEQDLWVLGYPERSTQWVAQLPRALGRDLKRYYRIVPGGGALIMRPNSTFTREWLAEVERRLDYFQPLLAQNPGGIRNEVLPYPVSWNDLLAKVTHPLALKHHRRVAVREDLLPDLIDYR